ncbi:E3 ubiquitin-protein ligase Rnf220 [Plutella xylostella]|uniref:E3 ubiquitin-protein ligase Rnf220 n=1 Tax=Plutella xylostella TaxID=51655 RepID=UPI002032E2B0|nr:E3 ubiquitin-protein ligase Rnf220 [Plutella xylostella]
MLPVLLYNNMEGSSNQHNNGNNSSFGFALDDNVILNSVRSRKKVQELPNCPVCSCTIRQGELETHMALEVERLTKLSTGGTKRKLSSTSSSSGLAVPGSSSGVATEVADEQDIDVSGCLGGDVYQRVHNNRLRRLRTRSRRSPAATGQCPVCEASVPVSKLQKHALRCLKRTGADVDEDVSSSEEGSIDVENDSPSGGTFGATYTWCGEERVRASALNTDTDAPRHRHTHKECDAALVVDGDEDTELYGPPQYSPSRIMPDDDSAPQSDPEPQPMNGASETADTPMRRASEAEDEQTYKQNGVVLPSAEVIQTRIHALKCRIKELEARQNGGVEAKCLICLGPYTSPAVSIQCWHVYCEICWLESLKAKKICPQCNAITTTQHLRRIYM